MEYSSNDFRLYHHGILGQKWGQKNGPPYPLGGGDYSVTEQNKIYKARKNRNSIYNKKHFDKVIDSKHGTLTTLSYDKNRTKDADMFYAAYTTTDKHQYNAMLGRSHKLSTTMMEMRSVQAAFTSIVLTTNLVTTLKLQVKIAGQRLFRIFTEKIEISTTL